MDKRLLLLAASLLLMSTTLMLRGSDNVSNTPGFLKDIPGLIEYCFRLHREVLENPTSKFANVLKEEKIELPIELLVTAQKNNSGYLVEMYKDGAIVKLYLRLFNYGFNWIKMERTLTVDNEQYKIGDYWLGPYTLRSAPDNHWQRSTIQRWAAMSELAKTFFEFTNAVLKKDSASLVLLSLAGVDVFPNPEFVQQVLMRLRNVCFCCGSRDDPDIYVIWLMDDWGQELRLIFIYTRNGWRYSHCIAAPKTPQKSLSEFLQNK